MRYLALSLLVVAACSKGTNGNTDGNLPPSGDMAGQPQGGDGAVSLPPLQYTSQLTITVEPEDQGQVLKNALSAATTSIHMTMYELSDSTVISTLESKSAAGLDVKVLLNQSFPSGDGSSASVYSELNSKHVPVEYAPSRYQYTHEKALVLDGKTAMIMTMNAASSAFTGNREYVATDTDPDDVGEAEAIFEADWANMATATTGKLVTAPDNAETRLVEFIDGAGTTIDLEGEVFSSNAILQAIGRAQKRGVTIRVVLSDEPPTSAQTQAVNGMKQVGIPVVSVHTPDIHAKAIVIDGNRCYIGSENFTANSLENNRELGVLFNTASEVQKVAATIDADFKAGTPL